MDRSWIQKSRDCVFRAGKQYESCVNGFLNFAFSKVPIGGKIQCPCIQCINQRLRTRDEVFEHLIVDGIMTGYTVWSLHGEVASSNTIVTENIVVDEDEHEDIVNMPDILQNVFPGNACEEAGSSITSGHTEGKGNEEDKFCRLMEEAEKELYPGSRRKRGRTRALRTNSRPSGEKVDVQINDENQTIGPNNAECMSYLGTLVRTPTKLPLNYPEWRKVPLYYKENVWNDLKGKFNLADEAQHIIFMRMDHIWRQFRLDLRRKTLNQFPTLREAVRPIDPIEIPEEQWGYLINMWTTERWLKKSIQNKSCRENQGASHTAGRTSFPQVKEIARQEHPDGQEPSRLEVFKRTHITKEGNIINGVSKQIVDKCNQKLDEYPTEMRDDKDVQDDVFLQVLGPETCGRVRGAGLGVKPSSLGLTKRNVEARQQQRDVQGRFAELEGQISTLRVKLEEMDELKAQLTILTQALTEKRSSRSSVNLAGN